MCTPNPEGFNVAVNSCEGCANIPKVTHICIKCGYKLKDGGLKAREICPVPDGGCGTLNSFIPAS